MNAMNICLNNQLELRNFRIGHNMSRNVYPVRLPRKARLKWLGHRHNARAMIRIYCLI